MAVVSFHAVFYALVNQIELACSDQSFFRYVTQPTAQIIYDSGMALYFFIKGGDIFVAELKNSIYHLLRTFS